MARWKTARPKNNPKMPGESQEFTQHVVSLATDSLNSTEFKIISDSNFFIRTLAVVHAFLKQKQQYIARQGKKPVNPDAAMQLMFILGYLAASQQWFQRLAQVEEYKAQMEAERKPAEETAQGDD